MQATDIYAHQMALRLDQMKCFRRKCDKCQTRLYLCTDKILEDICEKGEHMIESTECHHIWVNRSAGELCIHTLSYCQSLVNWSIKNKKDTSPH